MLLALVTAIGTYFAVLMTFGLPEVVRRSDQLFESCMAAPMYVLLLAFLAGRLSGIAGKAILGSKTAEFVGRLTAGFLIGILSGYFYARRIGLP